jgi:hypothetical protein
VQRDQSYFFLFFLSFFLSFFDFFAMVGLPSMSQGHTGRPCTVAPDSAVDAKTVGRQRLALLHISDVPPSEQQTEGELHVAQPTLSSVPTPAGHPPDMSIP